MNNLVFGKPFLLYHRSGHSPRPRLRLVAGLVRIPILTHPYGQFQVSCFGVGRCLKWKHGELCFCRGCGFGLVPDDYMIGSWFACFALLCFACSLASLLGLELWWNNLICASIIDTWWFPAKPRRVLVSWGLGFPFNQAFFLAGDLTVQDRINIPPPRPALASAAGRIRLFPKRPRQDADFSTAFFWIVQKQVHGVNS